MSKDKYIIDEEGFCIDCKVGHNCIHCSVMDYFVDNFNMRLLSIIKGSENTKKEENNKNSEAPPCGNCGKPMLPNKFEKGPKYWCPCHDR